MISFDWDKDKWSYADNSTKKNIKMTVKNDKEQREELTLLPPHKAKEMLGVNLAPDGNHKEQLDIVKEKMRKYAEYIRVGHVNRHEAWTSLSMMALKSLEYILPAMTLSETECNDIMKPVLKQFLPKIGINRNIKRDLLFAPSKLQGLNLKNPFLTQGIAHVKDLCENLWKQTTTGKLMNFNLQQLRIELGTNDPILSSSYEDFQHLLLTDSLITSTWQFMSKHGITLKDNTPSIPLLREKDLCLMDEFRKNPQIDKSLLPLLNRCRLYLKAFSLSDITEGKGVNIREEAWHGIQFDTQRDTSQWPLWGKPPLISWTKWRTALKTTFCTDRNRQLKSPLKNWNKKLTTWKWYSATVHGKMVLVKKEKLKWYAYKKLGRSRIQQRYYKLRKPVEFRDMSNLIPTTVRSYHKHYIMSSVHGIETNYQVPTASNSDSNLTSWLNIDRMTKGSQSAIKNAIINETAIAVSDGSYSERKGIGTASWIIATQNKQNLVTAGAISSGTKQIQSSYRSEILGLMGILEALVEFCHTWKITKGCCSVICDGLSALNRVKEVSSSTINSRQSCCDLLSACARLKDKLPIQIKWAHVKGHQDDETPLHHLSIPAQLNVLMDGIAKNMLEEHSTQQASRIQPHPLSLPQPLYQDRQFVQQDYSRELYNLIAEDKVHQYWIHEKERYTQEDIKKIDWDSQSKAMQSLRTTKQRSLTKWFSGWVAVGKNMEKWNMRYKGHCPFCKYPKETTTHVIKCQHVAPTEKWKELLKEYDATLARLHTNYYLRKAIIYDIWDWRQNRIKARPTLLYADNELQDAVMEQRSLGWKVFLEGLISTKIIEYQRNFHLQSDRYDKAFTWPTKVIKAGWKLITAMWDYRNDALHQTPTIEDMEGIEVINKVIKQERNIGLSDLPMLEFSHLFRISEEELMKKSTEGKKDWLCTVKMARHLHQDRNKQEDEIDLNDTLRTWIGLPRLQDLDL